MTTAAVCTALALIMCVGAAYLPLSIMPLYIAAFCIFLACKRGSIIYGALSALATIGIMFLMTGLTIKWFFLVLMFAPYGILTYFIHRYTYFKAKNGVIRGVTVATFFNLTLFFVYLVATRVIFVGLDVPISAWVGKIGYWAIALIGTVLALPLDFVFSTMSGIVLKRIPMPVEQRKADKPETEIIKSDIYGDSEESEQNKAADGESGVDGKKYDIFGYEIFDDKDDKS